MSLIINEIKIPLNSDESSLPKYAAKALGVSENDIKLLQIKRVSLDARKKNEIAYIYTVKVDLTSKNDEKRILNKNKHGVLPAAKEEHEIILGSVKTDQPIVIVGLGPAGLFAAYQLAKYGYKPIVIERGKKLEERKKDVLSFWHHARLNCDSNVMFGEGGAGTFSDGKLTTRIKDPRVKQVLEILKANGAPKEIEVMAKPHIGTDKLEKVVVLMRKEIINMGGEVFFETKLVGIEKENGKIKSVTVQKNDIKEKIECCACILAIGLGANDTYRMLKDAGLEMVPKPFAMGVRIEHPRELIDRSQYGEFFKNPRLGAAEYRLTGKSNGRGVYTFCMCPGGTVVACSCEEGQVVTNGMSYYARDAENSNSAIVVQVNETDFGKDPLAGLVFREEVERAAFIAGGRDYCAPASTVEAFLNGKAPKTFGSVTPTYKPGVKAVELDKCLPDFIAQGVRDGIKDFGRKLKGFDMPDAVITAVESRTSSPVRILRNELGEATLMSGLYPVGEGAGYAGGIVSAAVDGMKAAEYIMQKYAPYN